MVDRGLSDKKGSLVTLFDHSLHPQIPCASGDSTLLPSHFQPGKWDVICHSGKDAHNHVGNRRFRLCIENNLQSYSKAKSRSEKSAIISEIVTNIRESSAHGGGFVRLDRHAYRWYEVGDKVARDKVGQSLRNSSNTKANKPKSRKVHYSQVLPSTYTADGHIQPSSNNYSSRLQTLQETRTECVVGRVQPNFNFLSCKIVPSFCDSQNAAANMLTGGTTATDPLNFLSYSEEDDLFEGECRVGPHNQTRAWKASTELHKSVAVGLEQDDVEWFEADMRAT